MNLPMVAGGESAARISLLLTLLPKLSQNTCDALTAHFVNGYDAEWINQLHGINQPNFTRSINKLNAVNNIVEQIKESDFIHLSDMNSTVTKSEVNHA
ncbi:MAG: hypothetical protein ACI9VT_003727 [Psychroserpens sp.]